MMDLCEYEELRSDRTRLDWIEEQLNTKSYLEKWSWNVFLNGLLWRFHEIKDREAVVDLRVEIDVAMEENK